MLLPAMIFTNGRIVLPDRVEEGLSLRVADGCIHEIGASLATLDDEIVSLEGNYLAPGFIDLHVHGARGRDTMEGTAAAFRAICDYHASGGTTSLCLTTATAPLGEIVRVLRALEDSSGQIPQLRGAHVEGPFISPAKPGAQREEFIVAPRADLRAQLLEHSSAIQRLTLAPELPGALELIDQLHARGIAISGGHSDAWDEEARAAFEHGMRQVTHTFNCMSSMRRRGRARVAGLLEVALSEPGIFCELIADGHHVSPTLMRMLYRAKGARGICLVTDATAGAGLPNDSRFSLFGRECVVRSGVGWLADGSALAGSAARMIDLVREMIAAVGVSVPEAVRMATETPARAMGWSKKGVLAQGMDADLVVLSPQLEVVRTYCRGVAPNESGAVTTANGMGASAIRSSVPKASDS